jgi:hypothetical protein
MSVTLGHFDSRIFLPPTFPINVQGKPFVFVQSWQWYSLFCNRIAFDSRYIEVDRQNTIE